MTRKTSFYYSFLVLPRAKRDVIVAVWDFCRSVDDAVDLESDSVLAKKALETWRDEVERVFGAAEPVTPQGKALKVLGTPFRLPREQFDALIDGVAMDITPQRFQTFADLEPYCHRVASSVGLICAEIFGYHDPIVRDYARDLGVALQLTNILRDLHEDVGRGRIYLPQEELNRFHYEEAALMRGERNPQFVELMRFQVERAREYYESAWPLVDLLPATLFL